MASTFSLKQMGKLAWRLFALTSLTSLAVAACSSSDNTSTPTSCGNVAQCPTGQACYNNVCTPVQTATAGSGNVGAAGIGNVGAAGIGNVGAAGIGNVGAAGIGNVGAAGIGNVGAGGSGAGGATGSTAGSGNGTAGSGTGSAGGGSVTGGAGYWTSKDWHGCSWTGHGTADGTTITPADFTNKAAADPYCISGSVGATYASVALLGFNVAEPSSASCAAKPASTTAAGPPAVVPTADGIAVNFVKKGASTSFTFRVQIQGPNAGMPDPVGAADRWCATISEVSGKVFVPWSSFVPSCWETTAALKGTPYAKQPISAVAVTVPGIKDVATPFNVCVNGLAYGSTAADAPDGTAVQGDLTGTIGGAGTTDADFQRVKVRADGKDYIIQNNNWGTPNDTNQTLSYKNNSFKITGTTGSGQSAPASFPSIYIGNNGNTANGVFSTKGNDNLPILMSAVTTIPSTFRYSPAISSNAINATYDIWFANSMPTTTYNDGIDGFVMIWLYDPTNKTPIGTLQKIGSDDTVTVAGMKWKVYVGPRGPGPMGSTSNAPVVSFVNPTEGDNSRAQNFVNVDLKPFITLAQQNYTLPKNAYLTDIFAGFEIWDGGASNNLSVDEFKCVVNK